ncbi:MAG: Histone-lysine N-methyltransferase set9 [Alectoria sarmentosa]|nr:MAG: Histone-lysine N-methyltransferase set9 [Alectoria sarmentosa]
MGRLRKDATPPDTPPKKERLTLTQLAGYDDILTDALVDHVYFWTTIRKNRAKYNLTRGISEDDVCSILLHDVIVGKDSQRAESSVLQLAGIKKYFSLLKTEREKEDFRRHMRKYINLWLPDCPFEVSTTNRYTIVTHEASTTARRPIKQGDAIKYLCGNLVAMTPEEEKDLDLTRRDFSIVMSSRKKTPSLFLGPARFANHDCNANARLVTRGSDGMQVYAVRNIRVGEEITVNYGENYFGDGNWSSSSAISSGLSTPMTMSEQEFEMTKPYRSSRKRMSDSDSDLSAGSMSSDDDEENPVKKRKSATGKAITSFGIETAGDLVRSHAIKEVKPGSPLRQVLNVTDIVIPAENGDGCTGQGLSLKKAGKHGKTTQAQDDILAAVRAAFAGFSAVTRPESQRPEKKRAAQKAHPGARSYSDSNIPYKFRSPFSFLTGITSANSSGRKQNFLRARTIRSRLDSRKQSLQSSSLSSLQDSSSISEKDSTFDDRFRPDSSSATTPSAGLEGGIDWSLPPQLAFSPSSSGLTSLSSPLSSLPSIAEIDDDKPSLPTINSTARKRGRPRKIGRMIPLVSKPKVIPRTPKKIRSLQPTIELDIPSTRTPGDYIRTHLLLGESFSRWVDCRTCSACWVQANGYQTRKECPRCERHSKLYGYQWPKTDKLGKGDDEERVMDHRTVHRFIHPDEEKEERKKGRGVLRAAEEMGSERDDSTGDDYESERTDSKVRSGGGGRTRGVGPAVYTR